MKTITSRSEQVARLECSCCGSEHYIDIEYNKKYDNKDESDYLFEFIFNWGKCVHDYPSIKARIFNIKHFLFHRDERETIDDVLVEENQLEDLLEEMTEKIKTFLSKKELKEALLGKEPSIATHQCGDSDWYYANLFKSSDNLGISFSYFNKKSSDMPSFLEGVIDIGFYNEEDKSTTRRYIWNYLTKQSKIGFRSMYCSLTKADTIEFISVLTYIVNSNKKDRILIDKTKKAEG